MPLKKQDIMRKLFLPFLLLLFTQIILNAQEVTPETEAGEDFDLRGVLAVLENAEDLADFEKKINNDENQINNLDLNKDNDIDIVKVVEIDSDNLRVLVLRAVIGEEEFQDIATIEIEKKSDTEISLQIIGDPDIYGPNYVVEPAEEKSKSSSGGGNSFEPLPNLENFMAAVFVSVHRWRPIGPLFVVGRVAFVSAVGWKIVPVWFVIRRPIARSTWKGRSRKHSKSRVSRTSVRHSSRGGKVSSPHRKTSKVAKNNAGPKPGATTSKKPNTSTKKKPNTSTKKKKQ